MKAKQLFPWTAMTFTMMLGSMVCITSCSDDDDPTTDVTAESSSTDTTGTTTYDYAQVSTGQTALYDKDGNVVASLDAGDSCYGQDATYLKGATMSFTNNGDGTISDNNTGLMWEEIPTSDEFTWQEAIDYCNELELGGHSDWRMPSLKELFSISDFSSGWPYIDTDYFALASGEITKDEQYWSTNFYAGATVEGGNTAAFGVNHVTGHIKAYPAVMPDMDGGDAGDGSPNGTDTGEGTPPPPGTGDANGAPSGNPFGKYVRAVRGDEYGLNEFVDNNDGTITDKSTGLMWMQADSGEGLDWEAALAYAESATVAGYSDWRMPNVKELQGIVDYTYSVTAEDPSHVGPAIDPIFSCTGITSEAGYADYPYYWTGTSARFNQDGKYYYAWYVAAGRAVDGSGEDSHGAGAVRFDTKYEGGELGEGGERYYNYVRLVRNID